MNSSVLYWTVLVCLSEFFIKVMDYEISVGSLFSYFHNFLGALWFAYNFSCTIFFFLGSFILLTILMTFNEI